MTYKRDRDFSDRHIPTLKSIVGHHVVNVASEYIDHKEAGDLVILRHADLTVGARVRREEHKRWITEFTLRFKRTNGIKTELEKVMEGFMGLFIYGFDDILYNVMPWIILNMDVFRATIERNPNLITNPDEVLSGIKPNRDRTTLFIWFAYRAFPPEIVFAVSSPEDRELMLTGNRPKLIVPPPVVVRPPPARQLSLF
jgi:hypothetical protein